jgi:hypothetical protein
MHLVLLDAGKKRKMELTIDILQYREKQEVLMELHSLDL